MRIQTHYPQYGICQNPLQRVGHLQKGLRQALRFDPRLSPQEIFELGIAIFDKGTLGPTYADFQKKWLGRPVFQQIRQKAHDPRVRKIIAELAAAYAVMLPSLPQISPSAQSVETCLRGISKHLKPETALNTLVVAAGNVGREWLVHYPEQSPLTLIDINPFIAEFLESSAAYYQRRNVNILEGDIFDLPTGNLPYNVVHVGNFFHYLGADRSIAFLKKLPRLFTEKEDKLLIIQENTPPNQEEYRARITKIFELGGATVVEQSVKRTPLGYTLTLFVK